MDARHDGADDGTTGLSRYIAQCLRQLHVHLQQCFLHMLNMRRSMIQQLIAVPQQRVKTLARGGRCSILKEIAVRLVPAGIAVEQ